MELNSGPQVIQGRLDGRSLDDAVAEAEQIVRMAINDHDPEAVVALFSGGNDSTTVLYACRDYLTYAAFIDTGTGIPQTRQHVEEVCALNGIDLIIETPPAKSYEEIVLEHGFPGPQAHRFMYSWLKERALRNVRRRFVKERGQRVMFLTGVRVHESRRRMGTAKEVDRQGSVVWVAPIIHFTNDEMIAYRKQYHVPVSPVSARLGMSGECLCGAYAKPLELLDIEAAYPEVAERIRDLERRVAAKGIAACKWGAGGAAPQYAGPLCSSCVGQEELAV